MHATEAVLVIAGLAVAAGLLDLFGAVRSARAALAFGIACGSLAAIACLPHGTAPAALLRSGPWTLTLRFDPAVLWLLLPAGFMAWLAVVSDGARRRGWVAGAAVTLLGVLGVAGLQNGAGFLIAWELMSLGGALMLLTETGDTAAGQGNYFMLSLLEAGSVALLLAILLLGPSLAFSTYPHRWLLAPAPEAFGIALLFVVGFGAKLGLLPFYEWYPDAYGSGSGASGALLSGLVLNVAYFALGRALLRWLPHAAWTLGLGILVLAAGIMTAILAVFYAFQQNDWRRVLAFSSAENAGIAVAALGAALLFREAHDPTLAGLAWIVGLLHLMGHSLAKGSLFLTADAVKADQGDYGMRQRGLLGRAPWTLGIGAVLAAMSLAAMPPTAGFVSEWYLFQVLFHDFTLPGAGARMTLVLAGAGLALTVAVSLATCVKLVGVGLLGRRADAGARVSFTSRLAILLGGLAVPGFAASLVVWLPALAAASWPDAAVPRALVHGRILIPLSTRFAFISPLKLVIVAPLLALIPAVLVMRSIRRQGLRRAPLWCGGETYAVSNGATTSLSFANALRVFYSFIYRPVTDTARNLEGKGYVLKELRFDTTETPLFGPLLFKPLTRFVRWLADRIQIMQRGQMNAYLAFIGILLLCVLASVFF